MYSLAGRYDNPIPTRCLAPIGFLKIPAQITIRSDAGIEPKTVAEFALTLHLSQYGVFVLKKLTQFDTATLKEDLLQLFLFLCTKAPKTKVRAPKILVLLLFAKICYL